VACKCRARPETLLLHVVEDYLATATAAVGHVQEALGGLWGSASRCTSRDLRLGGVADEDDSGGSEPDDSAVGGESAGMLQLCKPWKL